MFDIERQTKVLETLLPIVAMKSTEPKAVMEMFDDFVALVYPDVDKSKDDFIDKAHSMLDRHLDKPFIVDPAAGGGGSLRPELNRKKE